MGSIETPAMTGLGRPGVLVRTKLIIAPVMTAAVVTGARVGGVDGVAIAWLVAFPFCYAFAFRLVLNAVGLRFGEMLAVIRGPAAAAAVMVVAVRGWHWLAGDGVLAPSFVLASEIALGAAVYLATLWLLDRNAFDLVRQRLGRVIGLRAAQ
jgi:hypothetical protein